MNKWYIHVSMNGMGKNLNHKVKVNHRKSYEERYKVVSHGDWLYKLTKRCQTNITLPLH